MSSNHYVEQAYGRSGLALSGTGRLQGASRTRGGRQPAPGPYIGPGAVDLKVLRGRFGCSDTTARNPGMKAGSAGDREHRRKGSGNARMDGAFLRGL